MISDDPLKRPSLAVSTPRYRWGEKLWRKANADQRAKLTDDEFYVLVARFDAGYTLEHIANTFDHKVSRQWINILQQRALKKLEPIQIERQGFWDPGSGTP